MKGPRTCWTLLEKAARGAGAEAEEFCALYRPLIVSFLSSRWRLGLASQDVEDAAQETLIECLREHGALERALLVAEHGFRAFLFGVTMNVARRFEERRDRGKPFHRDELPPSSLAPADTSTPERLFHRAWAKNVVRQAREAFELRAQNAGGEQAKRSEILRLRFFEDLPIRKIAEQWGEDATRLHHEYAKARNEFREALLEAMRFENQGSRKSLDKEMRELIAHLH